MQYKYLFYFCDGLGSVFDSQVLALLEAINERKVFNKIYLFLGIRNNIQKNEFIKKIFSPNIGKVYYRSFPNYPYFNFINRKSIEKALHGAGINLEEVIFHTRGEIIAWHLCKFLEERFHKNIIPDVRGASVEEMEEFYDLRKVAKSIKICNNRESIKNLNKFSRISVVSDSLKEYLVTNYQVNPENIIVVPCAAGNDFRFDESQSESIRKELNLNEDEILVVFSSGGTAEWQNSGVLTSLAEKGLRVLNLSKKEIVHKNVINKFVSYNEMPKYLNAANAAFIWRDNSIVNKVASPVKFSEYICAGLPVIASYSVDLIRNYISENDCGLLTGDINNIDMKTIQELVKKDRKKISEEGILNFGIDSILNKYFQIYSTINN